MDSVGEAGGEDIFILTLNLQPKGAGGWRMTPFQGSLFKV